MDRIKRKVAAECLGCLIDFHLVHNLWRVHSVWRDGLTPKEQAYLAHCEEDLKEVYQRIGKLQSRLNRT